MDDLQTDGRADRPGSRPSPPAPRVSVVVPTFDRGSSLQRAIRTVKRQTMPDWELLVVDDGSPSAVKLEPQDASDPRVRVISHGSNRGVAAARNTGIGAALAPWVAFLDDDDLWHETKLAAQLDQAERRGASFVFTSLCGVEEKDGHIIVYRPAPPTHNLTRTLLRDNLVGEPSSVMIRAELFDQVGGFDTQLSVVADWDMWVRISTAATSLGLDGVFTAVVTHGGSMQLSHAERIPAEIEHMRRKHAGLLARERMELGSPQSEIWMANKLWRGEPSPGSLAAYARAAWRHGQSTMIARRFVMTRVRRMKPSARQMAPDWVLEQLGHTTTSHPVDSR